MLANLVTGLILAGISALGYIAYKHPSGYKKIEDILGIANSIIFSIYIISMAGYTVGFYDGQKAGKELLAPTYPLGLGWAFLIAAIFYAYLFFLRRLPDILKETSTERKPKPSNKKEGK